MQVKNDMKGNRHNTPLKIFGNKISATNLETKLRDNKIEFPRVELLNLFSPTLVRVLSCARVYCLHVGIQFSNCNAKRSDLFNLQLGTIRCLPTTPLIRDRGTRKLSPSLCWFEFRHVEAPNRSTSAKADLHSY